MAPHRLVLSQLCWTGLIVVAALLGSRCQPSCLKTLRSPPPQQSNVVKLSGTRTPEISPVWPSNNLIAGLVSSAYGAAGDSALATAWKAYADFDSLYRVQGMPTLVGCAGSTKSLSEVFKEHTTDLYLSLADPPSVPLNMTVTAANNGRLLLATLHHDPGNLISPERLHQLFVSSGGFLTPCYKFKRELRSLHLGKEGILALFICWIHSLFASHPLTLVHFPRLILYSTIAIYRYIILYKIGGFVESTVLQSPYDFSDHLVLYLMLSLFYSLEASAARTSRHHSSPYSETWMGKKLPLFIFSFSEVVAQILQFTLVYSAFFTGAYFHHSQEITTAVILGLVGVQGFFWLLVSLNLITLSQLGIVPPSVPVFAHSL